MDHWALVAVGAMAVGAAWDFGRRLTQKVANAELARRIEAVCEEFARKHDVMRSDLYDVSQKATSGLRLAGELNEKLRGLASKQESQAAVSRPRGGFPRIG
jgi:hypothetical protein